MDTIIKKKNWFIRNFKWLIPSVIVALVLGYNLLFSMNKSKVNYEKERVTISKAKFDNFQDYIMVMGSIAPIKTVYLDALEGGRVEEIVAEEGSMVKKGDLLLKLSNTNLIMEISRSESDASRTANDLRQVRITMEQQRIASKNRLLEIEYRMKRLKRDYEYNSTLYKQKGVSKEEFLQSKENYEMVQEEFKLNNESQKSDSVYRNIQLSQLEISTQQLTRNLEFVRKRLENMNPTAPVSGELASLNVEIGQVIGSGSRIGQINVLDNYKIKAEIDEFHISRIVKGLKGVALLNDKEFEVKIFKIYPEVKQGRFNVDLVFTDKKPEKLRIGQTLQIRIELGTTQKSLLIERGPFFQTTGGQWIYVVNQNQTKAAKRNIRIGRQNPLFYEVLEGLADGESVIVSGYEFFGNNDEIIFK